MKSILIEGFNQFTIYSANYCMMPVINTFIGGITELFRPGFSKT